MAKRASLTLHDREVSSVFDLLGRDENDLTAAFGFTLARSPGLLRRIVQRVAPGADGDDPVLRLEARDERGRTDLEISTGDCLIVVEAKRGWLVPGETKLAKYAPRITAHGSGILVSLSAATQEWARRTLPATIQGIPVVHLLWDHVRLDLTAARDIARGQERAWLEEFTDYRVMHRFALPPWVTKATSLPSSAVLGLSVAGSRDCQGYVAGPQRSGGVCLPHASGFGR